MEEVAKLETLHTESRVKLEENNECNEAECKQVKYNGSPSFQQKYFL